MRLECVENGHAPLRRLELKLIGMLGLPPLDVVRTALYRPEFFGKPFLGLVQSVLRGDSSWTVGERELLAAFVSSRAGCVF